MAVWSLDPPSVHKAAALIEAGRARAVYRGLASGAQAPDERTAIVFLKDVFVILAGRNAHDAMLAAALAAPADRLFALVPTYYAACVLLHRRRFEEGFALFKAFRSRCLASLAALPTEDTDGFLVLFRHALLLTDEQDLDDPYHHQQLAANQALLDGLHWATTPPALEAEARPVLLVSCDQRYAGLFLARFLDSLDRLVQGRQVHLHLVDPDPSPPSPAALAALAPPGRNALAVTWEHSGSLRCSAYYASARFIRIGALLRHYRRPIQTFDVDIALRHPPEVLDRAMAGADFGCFRTGFLNPCSEYLAEVTAFMPTEAGLELADLVRKLILSKMSMKRPLLWLIDQAALYSAITILADKAGRLRVADFSRSTGMTNAQYIEQCDPEIDKLALMKTAAPGPSPA